MSLVTSQIAVGQGAHKCTPRKIYWEVYPGESFTNVGGAKRLYVTLSPDWDDTRILTAFGFTHAIVAGGVRGADGSQVDYQTGKTKVTITRSASTGIVVSVKGGRYAGNWIVEPCH